MLTIHELHEKLVNGDVSAVELTKAFLAHKDTVEPKVQAFLSDNREYALEAAAAVDAKIAAGETISDLAGVPVPLRITSASKARRLRVLRRCWKISNRRTMRRSSIN